MTTNSPSPKRGDIWLANFDPTLGAEIKKVRPAVMVSCESLVSSMAAHSGSTN